MKIKLVENIKKVSTVRSLPDGTQFHSLTVNQVEQLADQAGQSLKTIEITALQNDIVPLRYARNRKTYNSNDQIRLLQSRAAVIGLGGLGGTMIELLARAGVGTLTFMDGDGFEDHNLNRQILCTHDHLGYSKAQTAAERMKAINPSVEIIFFDSALNEQNVLEWIGSVDVVIDCLDNIITRFIVEKAARRARIPLISAAVGGLTGHVTTIFAQDQGLELIYGPQQNIKSGKGIETALGCLPQIVTLIAAAQSSEAIKVLLGQTEALLRNRMLMIDLASNTFEVLKLTKS